MDWAPCIPSKEKEQKSRRVSWTWMQIEPQIESVCAVSSRIQRRAELPWGLWNMLSVLLLGVLLSFWKCVVQDEGEREKPLLKHPPNLDGFRLKHYVRGRMIPSPQHVFFKTQLLIRIQSDCEIILQTQTNTPGNPGLSGSEVAPPVLALDARRESPLWRRLFQLTLQTLLRCLPCASWWVGAVTRCDLVSLSGGWRDTACLLPFLHCQSRDFFIKTRDCKSASKALMLNQDAQRICWEGQPHCLWLAHPLLMLQPRAFSHSWLMQSSGPLHLECPRLESSGHGHWCGLELIMFVLQPTHRRIWQSP